MAQLGQTQYYKYNTNGIDSYQADPYAGNTPYGATALSGTDYLAGLQQAIAQQNYLQQQGYTSGTPHQLANGSYYTGETFDPNKLNSLQSQLNSYQNQSGINAQGYIDPNYSQYQANAPLPSNDYLTPQAQQQYNSSNANYNNTIANQGNNLGQTSMVQNNPVPNSNITNQVNSLNQGATPTTDNGVGNSTSGTQYSPGQTAASFGQIPQNQQRQSLVNQDPNNITGYQNTNTLSTN